MWYQNCFVFNKYSIVQGKAHLNESYNRFNLDTALFFLNISVWDLIGKCNYYLGYRMNVEINDFTATNKMSYTSIQLHGSFTDFSRTRKIMFSGSKNIMIKSGNNFDCILNFVSTYSNA